MNKFRKLLTVGLLLFGLVFPVAACAEREADFIPPETEERDLTVGDIYDWNEGGDGSTRPDIGSGYYTPDPPPTEAALTIHESSAVTFADGSKSITLPLGSKLTQEDFAVSTLDGHTVGGLAVYGSGDEIVSFEDISAYSPEGEVTVAPYWAAENGDMCVYGSDGFDMYQDEDGIRWYSAPTTSNALVNGYPGALVTSDNSLNAGSRFRAKVAYDIEEGQSFDLYYRYQNSGDTEISFTVYQMIDGNDWEDESTWYDRSESITLAPGEVSDVIHLVIEEAKAGSDLLTVVKFDGHVDGFSLGAAMEMQMHPVKPRPVTVTLDLPDGVSVDGWSGEQMTGQTLVLPAAVSGTAEGYGSAVQGWYDVATGNLVTSETVLQGDMTIAPYFNVGTDTATQLTFGTSGDGGPALDNESDMALPGVATGVYDGYVRGTDLTGTAYTATSTFRVKCNYNWGNHTVTDSVIYYVITNNGTESISFSLNIRASGTAPITATENVEDLAPGQTVAVALEFTQTNSGASNLLTIINFAGSGSAFNLHVGVAVEKIS